jgi:hypothetical protein
MPPLDAKGSLFAGLLTAIGASVCCVGVLALLSAPTLAPLFY